MKAPLSLLSGELAQHVLENAAVLVVLQLLWRVDANEHLERRLLAVVQGRRDGQLLRHIAETEDVVTLLAGEAQRRRILSRRKLQRQDSHPHEVRAMDPLEAFGDHRPDAEQS